MAIQGDAAKLASPKWENKPDSDEDEAWTDEEEVQPGEPELPDGASPEVAPDRPVPRRISQNSKTKLNIYEVQVQKNLRCAEF